MTEPKKAEESVRERIMKAAMTAFMEQGYAGTSTLEIATRAKVSKRDIYGEFGNKQALLAACIATRSQRMRPPGEIPPIASREDLIATLTLFGKTTLLEVTHPQVIGVFRLAIAEAKRAPEVAQTVDNTGRAAVRTALREVIQKGLAAGLIAGSMPEMASEFASLLMKSSIMDILLGMEEAPSAEEAERRAKRAAEAFLKLHGVGGTF
ncbi:MAG TPA: TetR/AcrR family transcriptional regulator [Magnetospirillaceae bacterium]|nr:TetR/AcrR family transcriptional regulator [Magnetospirillaceae bacterium]